MIKPRTRMSGIPGNVTPVILLDPCICLDLGLKLGPDKNNFLSFIHFML